MAKHVYLCSKETLTFQEALLILQGGGIVRRDYWHPLAPSIAIRRLTPEGKNFVTIWFKKKVMEYQIRDMSYADIMATDWLIIEPPTRKSRNRYRSFFAALEAMQEGKRVKKTENSRYVYFIGVDKYLGTAGGKQILKQDTVTGRTVRVDMSYSDIIDKWEEA